ncbi:hypothetical protein BHE74_00058823 [Ensete ventricosum]|nr:hypothetical protein BHE74_00058823 [Ensete ventricosum]
MDIPEENLPRDVRGRIASPKLFRTEHTLYRQLKGRHSLGLGMSRHLRPFRQSGVFRKETLFYRKKLNNGRARQWEANLHTPNTKQKLLQGWLVPIGGTIVKRLVEVHLDVGIFGTLGEGVPFDCYIRVLPPKSLERHSVPELIADPPHFLEARLKLSGCLVGGYCLLTLGLQFSLEERYRLGQREDVALQASSVVPSPI